VSECVNDPIVESWHNNSTELERLIYDYILGEDDGDVVETFDSCYSIFEIGYRAGQNQLRIVK
jgi:hypothetical protein